MDRESLLLVVFAQEEISIIGKNLGNIHVILIVLPEKKNHERVEKALVSERESIKTRGFWHCSSCCLLLSQWDSVTFSLRGFCFVISISIFNFFTV